MVDIPHKFYGFLRELRSMRLTRNVGEMLVNVEVEIAIAIGILSLAKSKGKPYKTSL